MGQYAPQRSAADVDLAQGANNSPRQKDYIISRAWEMSHINQTVRIFNVLFITPSWFSIALFLSFSPLTSHPTPSSNRYRSELAGSRLGSIRQLLFSVVAKGTHFSETSAFISAIISSFCLSFSSGKIPCCSWQGFPQTVRSDRICCFCTDFHQPNWLRMSASGTLHISIHCIIVGIFKKRWNSCGTWLVGQRGKATTDVWLINALVLSHEKYWAC